MPAMLEWTGHSCDIPLQKSRFRTVSITRGTGRTSPKDTPHLAPACSDRYYLPCAISARMGHNLIHQCPLFRVVV